MGTLMAAQKPTSSIHSKSATLPLIHTKEGKGRIVKAEKVVEMSEINSLIPRNGGLRSMNEPICSESETGVIGENYLSILVDDDQLSEALVQFAVEESLVERKRCKRKCTSRNPIQEDGELSKLLPHEPDAYCSICMEPKFEYECFALKNCSHLYCRSCVCQYVEAKVGESATAIGCPDPNCKDGYLEPEMCRFILKPEVFNRWGTALCEAMIGPMKFYCPFKDCSALLIDGRAECGGEVITESECPHCFRLFCAKCNVPWHSELSCKEFSELGADERGREDIMLKSMAKNSKWQRCPSCKFYVEKVDGCMFIKCRCGYQFCYGCGRRMKVDHYCSKCKR